MSEVVGRLHIELPDDLHEQVKRVAAERGQTLKGLVIVQLRRVVDEFNKLPEHNRFIPGLRTWLGFKQASVPYDRHDRAAGAPKQTLRRLVRYALDGMFSFSNKPLRAATYAGFIVSAVSFLLALYYFVTFFVFDKQAGSGFTTIILCVLFLGGVQLITIGILGEYVGRVY